MKYLISKTLDPNLNLAMEEYLTKVLDETILYVFCNGNSVIIGKNQNPFSEVNVNYLKKRNIKIIRRSSGGGAVYHDDGNLNFAFILKDKASELYDFRKFSAPIVNYLKSLGVEAEFTGRNDLVVGDKKISGAAQYVSGNNLLHHGSLIFDIDLSDINNILQPNYNKLGSKGIKSVTSRVANIKDYLKKDINIEEFKLGLINFIADEEELVITSKQMEEIKKIAKEKEKAIEFILENKKQYQYQIVEYIPDFGTIEIYFNTNKDNLITELEIFGEYFFRLNINEVTNLFINKEYTEENITKIVSGILNFSDYFHKLKKEKLIELLMLK